MNKDALNLVNASGFAFQMAVEHAVRSTGGHNFAVVAREHPWRQPEGESGFADMILASSAVTWVVECKRTKDATWVFLCDKTHETPVARVRCLWVGRRADGNGAAAWYDVNCKPMSHESQFCAVRGTGEGQQPLLERISTGLVRSTDAVADEDIGLSVTRSPGAWGLYVPVIVTTAKLQVCKLDISKVSLTEGTVPDADFQDVPMVRFRKTFTAEKPPNAKATDLEAASLEGERTVLVVNASSLVEILQQTNMFKSHPFFDEWPWAKAITELGLT